MNHDMTIPAQKYNENKYKIIKKWEPKTPIFFIYKWNEMKRNYIDVSITWIMLLKAHLAINIK